MDNLFIEPFSSTLSFVIHILVLYIYLAPKYLSVAMRIQHLLGLMLSAAVTAIPHGAVDFIREQADLQGESLQFSKIAASGHAVVANRCPYGTPSISQPFPSAHPQ